jgi:hypothetical protein
VLHRQLAEDIQLPADARALISPELERVLLRALDRDPLRRYPDAQSFAAAFDAEIGKLVAAAPRLAVPRARGTAARPAVDADLALAGALAPDTEPVVPPGSAADTEPVFARVRTVELRRPAPRPAR